VLAYIGGGLFPERRLTVDGYELTFQVNHLAPFLLTNLLLDRLIASHGLVITTASEAHRRAQLDLNDLQLEHGWTSWRAYNRSKLANILFTRELHRRYVLDGIFAAAFHPGVVASGFAHDARWPTGWYYGSRVGQRLMVTPEQGADTLVWLADGMPPRDWAPGQYYIKRQISQPSRQARDAGLAGALWRRSAKLVGLPTEPQPVEQP
jgi:NAD(P)-dependent dehydrogenase (short-subunit alcohol dehydrogenase family)